MTESHIFDGTSKTMLTPTNENSNGDIVASHYLMKNIFITIFIFHLILIIMLELVK